jgi:hypothetical protein
MNVARFPAIRTVIFSVGAHPNPFDPLAIATIAVAGTEPLLFVALHAQGCGFHRCLTGGLSMERTRGGKMNAGTKSPEKTIGQPRSSEQVAIVVRNTTARRDIERERKYPAWGYKPGTSPGDPDRRKSRHRHFASPTH